MNAQTNDVVGGAYAVLATSIALCDREMFLQSGKLVWPKLNPFSLMHTDTAHWFGTTFASDIGFYLKVNTK